MKSKLSLLLLSCLICFAVGTLQSCSDDDDDNTRVITIDPNHHPILLGTSKSDTYKLGNSVTVRSESGPKKHQDNRSSDNFSTSTLKNGEYGTPKYMIVSCPENVSFRVCIDEKGVDGELNDDVYNGAILPYEDSDKFYIANPKNASSNFDVKFTAFYPEPNYTFTSSPGRALVGQDHRAGFNFVLPTNFARFKVHCSNPDATFGIYEDVTGSDNKIALNVKDGDYINLSCSKRNYYLYSPNSSKPFQVLFEPVTVAWMTDLNDDTSIADISMVGTHDTGTYALEYNVTGWSKCQNMDIRQQLEFGVRYFDLRVTDDMELEHGGLPCDVSFDHVVTQTTTFLDENPKEAVIFEITGDKFGTNFESYLDSHPTAKDYFWMGDTVPTLGDVRGKILVFRRYSLSSGSQGIDFYSDGVWPYDGSKEGTNPDGVKYYIEDRYFRASSSDDHDTHEKTDTLNVAIDYKLANKGVLCIAFSSISFSVSHTPYEFMWGGGAPAVDPKMCESMSSKLATLSDDVNCVGIIVMDYYNNNGHDDHTHLVEKIINTNFKKNNKPFDISRLHSSYD